MPPDIAGKRVLILSIGTRGDVQPFLVLAAALRRAGAEPLLATLPHYTASAARDDHRGTSANALVRTTATTTRTAKDTNAPMRRSSGETTKRSRVSSSCDQGVRPATIRNWQRVTAELATHSCV